jgi:hypothetical protein
MSKPPLPAPVLRVATLNTWGMRGDWASRLPVLRRGFAVLDADLLTLQETILTGARDQAAQMLPDGCHLAQQKHREDDGQGVTTASRWPFGEVIELDLDVTDRTGDFAATSLITEVLAPPPLGRVWLVNVRAREPEQRLLRLAVPAHRLHHGPLRPGRRPHAGGDPVRAHLRPGLHQRQ